MRRIEDLSREVVALWAELDGLKLASLPPIVTLKEIAPFYRISVSTIRRSLQNGTFSPRPWKHYPYRWRREDIAADLRRPRDEPPHKPHGFAARRRKKA